MNGDVTKIPGEVSKELETISFNALKITQLMERKDDHVKIVNKSKDSRNSLRNNKISPDARKVVFEPKTQLESFQNAMKLLFIFGQGIGLNPVLGARSTKVENIRFTVLSWRFLYCITIAIGQSFALALCFYQLIRNSISIGALAFLSFFGSTCTTTFIFIQVGYRWPKLMRDIHNCCLDEFIDTNIKSKCYIATVTVIGLSAIEHLLSLLHKFEHIFMCQLNTNAFEEYLKVQFPWYFELDVPTSLPLGALFQVMTAVTTLNWNYLDLFIVCISMYLTAVLIKINEKIIVASEKHYLSPYHWRMLREEYNRATRLVRSFDHVISGLVFTSFASNLFFICLQIFHIVAHGANFHSIKYACPRQISHGILGGYEYAVYLMFSGMFLLSKALAVSLFAAGVNTASLQPAQALYCVPSSSYCGEVSRFITQVNEDKIALSGLQFFYITRELVLTVAGTVVTYELVLLQFSGNDVKSV